MLTKNLTKSLDAYSMSEKACFDSFEQFSDYALNYDSYDADGESVENDAALDDALDALYQQKKTNNRKTLAPLFVYLILRQNSSKEHPLTQQQILDELEKFPYEIRLERKALSRVIHLLCDSQVNVHSLRGFGTWYSETYTEENALYERFDRFDLCS